jgi:uncharacterized protein (TIGR02246 family)
MTFRDALERHLRAIRERDLQALADTVAEKDLVLIMSDGRIERSTAAFLEAHRGWFAMHGWTLDVHLVQASESPELGVATLRLDYREPPGLREESYLTLVFQRRGDKWRMILDQNTPVRKA